MTLKSDINLSELFRAVHTCRSEVLFRTPEGDQLNLKSTLSQFVFAAALAGQLRSLDGELHCNEEDVPVLKPFLREQ